MQQLEQQSAALDENVEKVLALLEAAARGENVAFHLFEAVVAIQRGREERVAAGAISLEQRGRLLLALTRARVGAAAHLPDSYARAALNTGMAAMAYQIFMWTERPETTARRDPHDVLDFHDDARIFQNEIQNIGLLKRKAERAQNRATPGIGTDRIQEQAAN
jgi:hypothetical protein